MRDIWIIAVASEMIIYEMAELNIYRGVTLCEGTCLCLHDESYVGAFIVMNIGIRFPYKLCSSMRIHLVTCVPIFVRSDSQIDR